MRRIGFIGLGIMGRPMAKNLIKKGFELTVYDIMPDAAEALVKEGAKKAASCKEAASGCDIVITMLPNSPHVKEAVSGLRKGRCHLSGLPCQRRRTQGCGRHAFHYVRRAGTRL